MGLVAWLRGAGIVAPEPRPLMDINPEKYTLADGYCKFCGGRRVKHSLPLGLYDEKTGEEIIATIESCPIDGGCKKLREKGSGGDWHNHSWTEGQVLH